MAAGDPPGSPSVRAVLEEGSRHIGAKGKGALQTPRESGGGGGPGLGLGGVDRAGARKPDAPMTLNVILRPNEIASLAEELAYDLGAIEEMLTADGSMVRMEAGQITYLDISDPDNIIVYSGQDQGLNGIWNRVSALFDQLAS